MKLFYPLSSHSHKNCRQSEVSNGCFTDPQQYLVTDFQSSSKSPVSICVWWRVHKPWGHLKNSASSLTLGITKVLFFKAAFSLLGWLCRFSSGKVGNFRAGILLLGLCLLQEFLWRVSQMLASWIWVIANRGQEVMNLIDKSLLIFWAKYPHGASVSFLPGQGCYLIRRKQGVLSAHVTLRNAAWTSNSVSFSCIPKTKAASCWGKDSAMSLFFGCYKWV